MLRPGRLLRQPWRVGSNRASAVLLCWRRAGCCWRRAGCFQAMPGLRRSVHLLAVHRLTGSPNVLTIGNSSARLAGRSAHSAQLRSRLRAGRPGHGGGGTVDRPGRRHGGGGMGGGRPFSSARAITVADQAADATRTRVRSSRRTGAVSPPGSTARRCIGGSSRHRSGTRTRNSRSCCGRTGPRSGPSAAACGVAEGSGVPAAVPVGWKRAGADCDEAARSGRVSGRAERGVGRWVAMMRPAHGCLPRHPDHPSPLLESQKVLYDRSGSPITVVAPAGQMILDP
jgi:hypothetical protein